MAYLTLNTLICVKKQELLSKDKVHLDVGSKTVSGPHSMGKNDVVQLHTDGGEFSGSVAITLWEEDGLGKNDNLGTVTAHDTQADLGLQTGNFHKLSGADYHLKYTVSSKP
jgi:hypothetical protein